MSDTFLVFIGAGIGGVFRFWLTNISYTLLSRQFPYGTMIVNVTGCFFMGLLGILLLGKFHGITPQLRSLLLIGLLGGYTTFSSFTIETFNLFENGEILGGMMNMLLSISLCFGATWLGVITGRIL